MASSSTSSNKRLFLIGPGFIGGTLLVHLRKARPDLLLYALTRRKEQAIELQNLGITPIHGGLGDVDVIKEQVLQANIIIHTATADDAIGTQAIVDALQSRNNNPDVQQRKVVYIQTSGNDELINSATSLSGKSIEERSLSDIKGNNEFENGRIQPNAPHRDVDGALRKRLFNETSEKQYNVSTAIMMPPVIYGIGAEPWRRISDRGPTLAKTMINKGLATLPNDFKGAWNAVNVHDLAQAYLVLLKELEQHIPGTSHPSHYCFPAERQVFFWKDLFDAIVERLQHFGYAAKSKSNDVKVIEDQQALEDFVGREYEGTPMFAQCVFGPANSFTLPDRLTANGFKHAHDGPVHSIRSEGELDQLIKDELHKIQP